MNTAKWFTPCELAALQRVGDPNCRVELPAMQRGAVWRPHQTELLWDSLLRGFPIGTLILTPYNAKHGRRNAQFQDNVDVEPDFHILDGQQRWNSITLGFVDIWQIKEERTHPALWIDLDPRESIQGLPTVLTESRHFVMRVITRSHPWGYDKRDPKKRLSSLNRQKAFLEFEALAKAAEKWEPDFRPGSFPTSLAFPWDAVAPVPVPLLINAVQESKTDNQVWEHLGRRLSALPHWDAAAGGSPTFNIQKHRVTTLLQNPRPHMERILTSIKKNLGLSGTTDHRIPALIVPNHATDGDGTEGQEDPLLTMFVRMNISGTRPSDDDLRFSVLKSVCPDVQSIAEQLGQNLMSPAKLVTLISRLILSREATEPPVEPNLTHFRRLVGASLFSIL